MVPGCKILVELTQIPNLYLADLTVPERRQQSNLLPHLSPGEVNLHRETTIRMEYSLYQLHRQMEAATRPTRMKLCHQQKEVFGNRPVTLPAGGFGFAHGELHYQYQCRVAQAEIAEDNRCWKDVPSPPTRAGWPSDLTWSGNQLLPTCQLRPRAPMDFRARLRPETGNELFKMPTSNKQP